MTYITLQNANTSTSGPYVPETEREKNKGLKPRTVKDDSEAHVTKIRCMIAGGAISISS